MTAEQSKTPRTDALWKPQRVECEQGSGNFIFKFADNSRDTEYDFARTLERELSAALVRAEGAEAMLKDDGALKALLRQRELERDEIRGQALSDAHGR